VTPQNGRIVIIRTGDAAGVFYYDKTSSTTVDDIDVIVGPGSVGRFLRLAGGSGGSIAAGARVNKVANVEALFDIVSVSDNDLYQTLGYSTEGVGANLYRYDASSTSTIDGGFVLPGPGGTLSFSGTTFNGDEGDGGRFIAVDQTVADVAIFGGLFNGVADDYNAFLRSELTARTTGKKLVSSATGISTVSATLNIQCNCDLENVTLSVAATSVSPVVRVGSTTGSSGEPYQLNVILPKVTNTLKVGAGWSGFDSTVGVEIGNLYESRVRVPLIQGFGIGLDCGGYTQGFVYNEVFLGSLWSNKINLQIKPHSVNGWANENVFYGGRFYHSSAEGDTVAGIVQLKLSNPTGSAIAPPNNNVFIKPSLEGDEPQYHLDIEGSDNTFLNPRIEVPSGNGRVRFYSQSSRDTANNRLIGPQTLGIDYTFDGALSPMNHVDSARGNNSMDVTGAGLSIVNRTSSGETAPHLQGFESDQSAIDKSASSTNWTYRLYANGLSIKGASSTYARIKMTSGGFLYLGNGSVAADAYIGGVAGGFRVGGLLEPYTDLGFAIGSGARRWNYVVAKTLYTGSGSVLITSGNGSPEGALSAPVGSMYTRTDGGAGSTLYIKESGSGNTGWVAK
jgi:hypothetical protein